MLITVREREYPDIFNRSLSADTTNVPPLSEETMKIIEETKQDHIVRNGRFIKVDFQSMGLVNEILVAQALEKTGLINFPRILEHGPYNEDSVNVYEEIKGITLDKYVKICDRPAFVRVLSSILNILFRYYKEAGFTHYDLHPGNIMVGEQVWLIDFNFSYVETDPRTGYVDEYQGVDRRTWWGHDIIKLLMVLYGITNVDMLLKDVVSKHQRHLRKIDRYVDNIDSDILAQKYPGPIASQYRETENYDTDDEEADDRHYLARDALVEYARKQLKDKTEQSVELAKIAVTSRVSTYNEINAVLAQLLEYFSVTIDDTISTDPDIYVPYLMKNRPYLGIRQDETEGGSFEDFMTHAGKYL